MTEKPANMSRAIKFKVHKPVRSGEHLDSAADPLGAPAPQADSDALMSFAPEGADSAPFAAPSKRRSLNQEIVIGAVIVVISAVAAGSYFGRSALPVVGGGAASASSAATGSSASIDSRPPGADITIDGVAHGKTPAKIAISPGRHSLDIRFEGTTRSLVLEVEPGTNVSQYVEFAPPPAAATAGRLDIASDPSGAQVTLDGEAKGRTPLSIASVAAGEHTVVISSGSNTVTRRVTVGAGTTASIFAAVGAGGAAAGWLAVKAPLDFQIFEDGRLLGTTAADRLMLPAGRHQIELVNASLDYRQRLTVQVTPGGTTTTAVEVPNGTLSVNALPWADVWIDGRSYGATPLGNISLPIGSHEVVWRHPQFGERRRTVSVGASTPVRVGVDFGQ